MKEITTLRPVTLYHTIDHVVFENFQDAKAHEKKYLYDPTNFVLLIHTRFLKKSPPKFCNYAKSIS